MKQARVQRFDINWDRPPFPKYPDAVELRDRKMARNWGAHRPRQHVVVRFIREISRFRLQAQIRNQIFKSRLPASGAVQEHAGAAGRGQATGRAGPGGKTKRGERTTHNFKQKRHNWELVI